MKSRGVYLVTAILVVVLAGSFSTARAEQLFSRNVARSRVPGAHLAAERELRQAARLGLLPSELAFARGTIARLDHSRPPSSSLLWDPSGARFYRQLSKQYRQLRLAIKRRIRVVTRATRAETQQSLDQAKTEVARARTYGLDASATASRLRVEQIHYRSARTLAAYRAVIGAAAAARENLAYEVGARIAVVNSLLAQGGHHLSGVMQQGAAAARTANAELAMISLVSPRSQPLSARLGAGMRHLHAQNTALGAAVQLADLQSTFTSIRAAYQHLVPAKLVVVSTENESATMYQNGRQVYSTPVTTGGPELPTDHGVFHIYFKESPFVFHSPFPLGSPYYYPPTPIHFWMPFDGQEGLHDAWWRSNFGPGSNFQPTDLGTGNYILGTHGCVNLPYNAAAWLWNWAPVGTTVVVN